MRIKNSFIIAKEEIRNEKFLFLIFSIITILLFSVSVAIMDAAVYLPEHISKVVHDNRLDSFYVSNYTYPEDIKKVLDEEHIDFNIDMCNTPFPVASVSGDIYGGILFQDYLNDNDKKLIVDSLAEGTSVSAFFENSCMIISDEMAEKNDLHTGSSIDMIYRNKNEERFIKAEICGIFKSDTTRMDYYASDGALNAYLEEFPDYTCTYEISPKKLRDIFDMKSCLEKDGYPVYSKETVNTIRMLYITLYSVNFILLTALAGSVYNFMNIYLQRRKMFYAVQSAIGMSDNNILKILFSISELVVLVMLAFSSVLSVIILRIISGYARGVFEDEGSFAGIPFIPVLADVIIVQLCLAVIMLKFRKRIKNNDIIKLLHEE